MVEAREVLLTSCDCCNITGEAVWSCDTHPTDLLEDEHDVLLQRRDLLRFLRAVVVERNEKLCESRCVHVHVHAGSTS